MKRIVKTTKEELSESQIFYTVETIHGEDDVFREVTVPDPLPPWAVDYDHYISVIEGTMERSIETGLESRAERRADVKVFRDKREEAFGDEEAANAAADLAVLAERAAITKASKIDKAAKAAARAAEEAADAEAAANPPPLG